MQEQKQKVKAKLLNHLFDHNSNLGNGET